MASYADPSTDLIRTLTGVNELMDGTTEAPLLADLTTLLPIARTRTTLNVGKTLFESADLEDEQASALTYAVAFRVGALYIRGLASKPVTGTEEPRLMEEAEALRAQADALDDGTEDKPGQAAIYEALAAGTGGEAGQPVGPAPFMIVSTFEPGTLTRRPSDRIGSLDERDDIPAGYRDW